MRCPKGKALGWVKAWLWPGPLQSPSDLSILGELALGAPESGEKLGNFPPVPEAGGGRICFPLYEDFKKANPRPAAEELTAASGAGRGRPPPPRPHSRKAQGQAGPRRLREAGAGGVAPPHPLIPGPKPPESVLTEMAEPRRRSSPRSSTSSISAVAWRHFLETQRPSRVPDDGSALPSQYLKGPPHRSWSLCANLQFKPNLS